MTTEQNFNTICKTKNSIKAIEKMALEYMQKEFTYGGKTFCPAKQGWKFEFNNLKRSLGQCVYSNKTIYLSNYLIKNCKRGFEMWVDTMIHEIAHAFVFQVFNETGHTDLWRNVFISFGGNGNRVCRDIDFGDLIKNPISKYTQVCDNCGKQTPAHRKSKTIAEGRLSCYSCCNNFNNGKYSDKYPVREIKNY